MAMEKPQTYSSNRGPTKQVRATIRVSAEVRADRVPVLRELTTCRRGGIAYNGRHIASATRV